MLRTFPSLLRNRKELLCVYRIFTNNKGVVCVFCEGVVYMGAADKKNSFLWKESRRGWGGDGGGGCGFEKGRSAMASCAQRGRRGEDGALFCWAA